MSLCHPPNTLVHRCDTTLLEGAKKNKVDLELHGMKLSSKDLQSPIPRSKLTKKITMIGMDLYKQ